jgi:cell wall-associated NlpC family hydrolase
VFWDLNTISYEIIEEVVEPEPTPTPEVSPTPSPNSTEGPTPEPTTEPTPQICRTLIISIESKTYEEGIEIYKMSEEQIEVLEEMISADYLPMFMEICGMDSYIGLTSEQMLSLINDLPSGKLGSVIVEYALSRLGDPYSQPKRGQGDYVDCSYLTLWCYLQAGVSSFTAGTAAEQARYCVDNNLCVAYSALQPGDLIFWSFNTNGRFMNVTHTGIYAGNGYVIDASSSRGMVVYRPIFGVGSIVACGRPHVKN